MLRKIVSGTVLTLLLMGMLTLAFDIRLVNAWAGTVTIKADGSIDPPDAPISTVDNVTYTLTGNITSDAWGIVVERSNIIIDGNGYTLQGGGSGYGFNLTTINNVTIKNTNIKGFYYGVCLDHSSNNIIFGNNITNNWYGVCLGDSSNYNRISENNITNNGWCGIDLYYSSNNSIYGNNITENNWTGIWLEYSSNNTIRENSITNNDWGIDLYYSSNSNVVGNSITNNNEGIWVGGSTNNSIVGNSITNNSIGVDICESVYSSILGNTFTGCGLVVYYSEDNNVEDNTVNDKPLVYLEGVSNYTVGDAGQVILVDCNAIRVENLNLSDTTVGVQLERTNNSTIANNNMTSNEWGMRLEHSFNNNVSGNSITTNNIVGVELEFSDNNTVSDNGITNNKCGCECYYSSHNSIIGNSIVANNWTGIWLSYSSNNNSIVGNSITNNHDGISLTESSNNSIFRNDFINNVDQVYIDIMFNILSVNVWDDGYPSGGNYWSDYAGVDEKSGPIQDQPGSDGIGDIPYVIDADNRDRYPLMSPEHELVVSITPPVSIRLGCSLSLDATVTNVGLNNETNVDFLLFINSTIVNSTTIPLLKASNSYTLSYLWTPTVEGTYNVTAYARPVTGETFIENNRRITFIIVVQVGVNAGDWIKCAYTISGWPSGTPYPEWLKVEFLSVEGTNATIRVTMRMSDGTQPSQTMSIDVVAGGGAFQGLSGFVIPANCTTGDSIYMSGYGNVTTAGETTGSYAGATRTVVSASFSQYGTQLTYYWDKLTGAMVEASVVSGGVTATGKATETNMWQPAPGLPIDPLILAVLIAIVIVIVIFLVRRKKKPPEALGPET